MGRGWEFRRKNAFFLSKRSKKLLKLFFWPVFQNIVCGAEILAKTASFYCSGRHRKINLVDL